MSETTSIRSESEPTGIGDGGRTLREMLAESRKSFSDTGCYAGLTELKVLRQDPIRSELFHSRILAALIAGRETTKMISGSPFVREVAELAIGLYTPEGDSIAQSTGIQAHSQAMGEAIKWMIENDWESKVGIDDGDLFWFNECSIAGMHPADVYDFLPIFSGQELVAWVCTVIMEMDIGAVTPGCMPTPNVERATDGVRFAGEKVGTRDTLRHDIVLKCELSFDMSDIFLLDRKGAIAANIRVREEVIKLIDEFGLDYFKAGSRELIEDERRNQIARIRQRTVPGRYRNVGSLEYYMADQPVSWLPAKRDHIRLMPLEMQIETSGRVVLDFEGAGEWGWHPFNATPSGLSGGLSIAIVQTLSYDGRANIGSLLPFDLRIPKGSVLNPTDPRPLAQASIWAPVIDAGNLWLAMLGQAYYQRGFREETFGYRGSCGLALAGYDQFGVRRPMLASPTGNLAPGATGIADGLDAGGMLPTPEADLGNSEIWETFMPYLDMSHRLDPWSVGHGRLRSGLCIPHVQMIHGGSQLQASALVSSGSGKILPNLGAYGGYPGCTNSFVVLRNTNTKQLMAEQKPLLYEVGHPDHPEWERIEGDLWTSHHMPAPFELNQGDILVTLMGAGGGLGDPLERDPASIRRDLDNGLTAPEMAREIYAVDATFDPQTKLWQIDDQATEDLRAAKRRERLQRAVPVEQWWTRTRERLDAKAIHPLLAEMYQSSMKLSDRFSRDFREFWGLPEDANFEVN